MLIDTHTHLYLEQFDKDRNQIIKTCNDSNIKKLLLPNIDHSTINSLLDLCSEFPDVCYPMLGLHPCSVNDNFIQELEKLKILFNTNKFIAIGETGIDLYWDKSTLDKQIEAFKIQINWAKEKNLALVIHARNAFDEIFAVLDKEYDDNLRGVFHCFSGNLDQSKRILDYGNFIFGVGGVLTFKNSGLDKVIQNISIENIILETDSPYLAPAPHRGKRNDSTYLTLIADKLADIYNISTSEVSQITSKNAKKLFKI